MFSKSIFVFAFLAVSKLAVATPPACLLSAIMTQDDPSKVSDICKNGKMSGYISGACGDETQQAMVAYSAVCKEAGVTVATSVSASSSASATGKSTATQSGKSASITATVQPSTSIVVYTSASFDSSCSCTKTAAITSTEVSGPTGLATQATGTATGTGVPQSTGAAGRLELGAFAAFAGVAAGVFAVL